MRTRDEKKKKKRGKNNAFKVGTYIDIYFFIMYARNSVVYKRIKRRKRKNKVNLNVGIQAEQTKHK